MTSEEKILHRLKKYDSIIKKRRDIIKDLEKELIKVSSELKKFESKRDSLKIIIDNQKNGLVRLPLKDFESYNEKEILGKIKDSKKIIRKLKKEESGIKSKLENQISKRDNTLKKRDKLNQREIPWLS